MGNYIHLSINIIFSILISLFSPVLGFLLSLKSFNSRGGHFVFILFFCALNYCITFRPIDDIYRYIQIYATLQSTGYIGEYGFFMDFVYKLFSSYNLSPIYLYTLFSVLYANGFYLCLRILFNLYDGSRLSLCLFISCIFFIAPSDFSAFRFYTASFYFIYFIWRIEIQFNSKWNKICLLVPILIHPSSILMILAYVLYKWKTPAIKTLVILAVTTLIFHFFNLRGFLRDSGFEYFSHSRYLSEERSAELTGVFSIGQQFYIPMLLLLIYGLYIQYKKFQFLDDTNKRLLCLALFSLCFFNFSANSPDLYLRYVKINFWFCAIAVMYYHHMTHDNRLSLIVLFFPIAFFFLSYDFLFCIAPFFFDYSKLLTFDLFSMYSSCKQIVEKIW